MTLCWVLPRSSAGWWLLLPGAPGSGSCLLPPPVRPLLGLLHDPALQHMTPRLSKSPGLHDATYHPTELMVELGGRMGLLPTSDCSFCRLWISQFFFFFFCYVNVAITHLELLKISISQGRRGRFPNLNFKGWAQDKLQKASIASLAHQRYL